LVRYNEKFWLQIFSPAQAGQVAIQLGFGLKPKIEERLLFSARLLFVRRRFSSHAFVKRRQFDSIEKARGIVYPHMIGMLNEN